MFELIIIISRYVFLLCIGFFLLEGVLYVSGEREIIKALYRNSIARQRSIIIIMHIAAMLILSYIPDTYQLDKQTLTFGGLSLFFIIFGLFFVDKLYKNSCPLMWSGVFFLLDVGLIMLTRLDFFLAQKQLMWILLAFALTLTIPLVLKFIPKFEKLEIAYLIAGFVLLLSPLIIGEQTHGSYNWITVGGIKFQPSEIVKFLYVFYLASVFRKKLSMRQLLFPLLISALFVCILVVQRDLGGALIFFMTFLVVFYISTGNVWIASFSLLCASVASYAAYMIFPHIQTRVIAWQDPWQDASGAGYQVVRSLFAIVTWGVGGSGLTRGLPHTVPVVESDFIFSAICEELGSLFGIGMLFVFIMIFYRGVHISLRCGRRYYSLLAAGFTSMLAFQTFLIIGGVIKFIPLTGVTLPFVSYGGTSVFVSLLMIGILQWIYMYNANENGGGEQ